MASTDFKVEDGKVIVRRMEDAEPVLRDAANRRAAGEVGSSEMRHAARFPATVVENYLNRAGITLAEFLKNPVHAKRMLNDPDLAGFRVWQGVA